MLFFFFHTSHIFFIVIKSFFESSIDFFLTLSSILFFLSNITCILFAVVLKKHNTYLLPHFSFVTEFLLLFHPLFHSFSHSFFVTSDALIDLPHLKHNFFPHIPFTSSLSFCVFELFIAITRLPYANINFN